MVTQGFGPTLGASARGSTFCPGAARACGAPPTTPAARAGGAAGHRSAWAGGAAPWAASRCQRAPLAWTVGVAMITAIRQHTARMAFRDHGGLIPARPEPQ